MIFRDPLEEGQKKRKADTDLFIKVIDFGIAGVCDQGKADKGDAGSLCYMSPECLQGSAVESAPSIDVWAIGIMFYAMMFGTLPFYGDDESHTIKLIKTAPIKWDKEVPITPMAKEIITKMLEKDPKERLDLMNLLDMEFVTMEDEQYQEMVDKNLEEFTQRMEESKTQEPMKVPSPKNKGGKPSY